MKKIFAIFLVLLALPALAEDAPAKCKLVRIANWHVRFLGTHAVIDGYVNGDKKIGVLIDTGAYASILTKSAAERLQLPTHSAGQTIYGIGGGESRMLLTHIDDIRIGDFSAKGLRVRVAGEIPFKGEDFILGQDFLQRVDIEFDYANGAVRLYQPLDCKGKSLAYWDADAQQLPLSGSNQDIVPVVVNGRKADAMIDSGGAASMVQLAFAKEVGVTPESPGVRPTVCAYGLGAGTFRQWVATFDSIGIGAETIRNGHVRIGDLNSEFAYWRTRGPDMMLGGDFLKSHHVLISHSQGKMYVTYSGGQVFPATPALDCGDERVAGKNAKEALAAYDEILAKDPRDVKALLHRSRLRLADKNTEGALADLDAAIGLQPGDPVALNLRSWVRALLKDYKGALADSDAAMAAGMRNADILVYRAGLRRAAGDTAGMLAELDEALTLDPHHIGALRTRARFLYFHDKYAAAEADLANVLAIRADAFDSIWVYLARSRQGIRGVDALEQGLAALKGDDWPAPVMQHLLERTDREALMKAAASDEKQRKGRECEARFYMAEKLLVAGNKEEARPLLEAAREGCPTGYIEYDSAIAELERLK